MKTFLTLILVLTSFNSIAGCKSLYDDAASLKRYADSKLNEADDFYRNSLNDLNHGPKAVSCDLAKQIYDKYKRAQDLTYKSAMQFSDAADACSEENWDSAYTKARENYKILWNSSANDFSPTLTEFNDYLNKSCKDLSSNTNLTQKNDETAVAKNIIKESESSQIELKKLNQFFGTTASAGGCSLAKHNSNQF